MPAIETKLNPNHENVDWNFTERVDFISISGSGDRTQNTVNSGRSFEFEPFVDPLGIGVSRAYVAPFTWDAVKVDVVGVEDARF